MNTVPRTETPALIIAMEHLAKTISKNGGIAAVTIQEGADRLRELEARAECERLKELLRIESASAQHALAWAERAEAEVKRLKGMRTAAEAIMTDVAEANEELAIARAEKAEAALTAERERNAQITLKLSHATMTPSNQKSAPPALAVVHCSAGLVHRLRAISDDDRYAIDDGSEQIFRQAADDIERMSAENERLTAKIANQADRIRYLEGATNHATGTPLSLAIARAEKAEAEVERLLRYDAERQIACESYFARAERAEAECLEQARLLGMSASREASLLGKISRLEHQLEK